MKVLIIEDHATDRKLLSVVLKMDGHAVREELLAAGCEAYIVKPIDTRELPRQLAELAGRKTV